MPTPASISVAQLRLYAEFEGDVDLYQRRGMPKSEILGDIWGAWSAIEDLRRRLFLVATGRVSAKFAASAEADLLAFVPDDDARRMLRAVVERDIPLKSYRSSSNNRLE
jgi:hypothetical protein